MNRLDEALTAIDNAIVIAPRFQRWRYTRALVLSRMGRKDEAVREFSNTIVYSRVLPDGSQKHVYFNGEREYQRARHMDPSELLHLWHYGGRWHLPGTEEYYYEWRRP